MQPSNVNSETEAQIITRLAALSPIDYDRARKDAAQKLGVSIGALDKQVYEKQGALKNDSAGSKELFTAPEPWPDEVNPAVLLDELAGMFRRYAVLPNRLLVNILNIIYINS